MGDTNTLANNKTLEVADRVEICTVTPFTFQSTLLSGGDVIIVISSGHNHFWISVSSFTIG